jgi:antitoxin component YwqK of YwqJK toxin-antitoxin module
LGGVKVRVKVVWYDGLTDVKYYEGEALDGKEDGYGKLYHFNVSASEVDDPPIRYEGFGTEYTWKGCIRYEGEWENGNFHGYGNLYSNTGEFYYEGEFRQGLRIRDYEARQDGFDREYYEDGSLKYEGTWKNGRKEGFGKGYWENGTIWYEGEFKNDKPHMLCDLSKDSSMVQIWIFIYFSPFIIFLSSNRSL